MRTHQFFFSFRTCDKEHVDQLRKGIEALLPNFPFEDSSASLPFSSDWQLHATSAIKLSDGVICVIGESTHESEPVNWEIEEAHRLGKPLIVVSRQLFKLPCACERLGINPVTSEPKRIAERIIDLLIPKALLGGDESRLDSEKINLLWNQYNLMVQSWESLISRRQTVNNLYLTANTTILAAIGVFLGSSKNVGLTPSLSGSSILAVLGILLGLNWLQTVVSYGTLSQAKSKVVLALETNMPAKLFDTEWAVLETKSYRSTTTSDKLIAKFFIALFCFLFLITLAMSIGWISIPS